MDNPFQPFIDTNGVVILDGALATELEDRGADLNDPLWSAKVLLETPDLIRQVHLDYFEAGADIATTARYAHATTADVREAMELVQSRHTPDQAVAGSDNQLRKHN